MTDDRERNPLLSNDPFGLNGFSEIEQAFKAQRQFLSTPALDNFIAPIPHTPVDFFGVHSDANRPHADGNYCPASPEELPPPIPSPPHKKYKGKKRPNRDARFVEEGLKLIRDNSSITANAAAVHLVSKYGVCGNLKQYLQTGAIYAASDEAAIDRLGRKIRAALKNNDD